MGRKINIEEVRGFLEASNRQFEQGGIYLERALFKRDDNGVLTGITLSYEDRTTSELLKYKVECIRESIKREPFPPYKERLHPRKHWQRKPYWLRTRSNPKKKGYH